MALISTLNESTPDERTLVSTVRAYLLPRLESSLPTPMIRNTAIKALVDLFAEQLPDEVLVEQYRRDITVAVDQVVREFGEVAPLLER